jgi:hypothetical protein
LFARLFYAAPRSADAEAAAPADPLAAFSNEAAVATPAPTRPAEERARGPLSSALLIALGIVLAASSIAAVALRKLPAPPAPQVGSVTVDTVPAGVMVNIDGRAQGRTPVRLSLAPGLHQMMLIADRDQRTIPLTVVAGRDASEHFEFAAKPTAPSVGTLSVTADVPSRVSLDGRALGSTPVVLSDVAPGDHVATVTSDSGTVTRKVVVSPGATASVAVSFAVSKAPGPAAGWMSFTAPFDLQVFEGKDLIGSSGGKVMVAAGHHDVRLVNEGLQYSETRAVDVTAGKVAAIQIDPPHTTLNVNARPWADVSIDGTEVGQTPLGNVSVTIGTHVVVFRHPQLGEQRRTITATAKGPNRISADLTAK